MKIAIIGLGSQGQSAFEYWYAGGHEITICDQDESAEVPNGASAQLGRDHLKNLDQFDMIVRSPIVHPRDIVAANTPKILEKVTTNTNEFFAVCPTKNIIGVTGTKGKGTTSSLIAKMLEASGKRVHLGGNIGIPPLELLKNDIQPDDWVVLELANFQLIDIKHSPHIAVCLMVVSEHLDWHPDVEEYVGAKQQLFRWQQEEDIAIFFEKNELSTRIASASPGKHIPYYQQPGAYVSNDRIMIDETEICSVNDIKLLGRHNWQNVCAAVTAVWQVTHDASAIQSVISTFTGLEYRLEFVRELDGVRYYNDSFGTTPETAIVAIESFQEPKVLIAGGSEKGADYNQLVRTIIENNVKFVVCIGITGKKIATLLEAHKDERCVEYTVWSSYENLTMPEIVATARDHALSGDVVLLSCGSASFDMFKNYKDRGEQFKQAVSELV